MKIEFGSITLKPYFCKKSSTVVNYCTVTLLIEPYNL